MLKHFTRDTTSALQFFQAARFGTSILISIFLVRFLNSLSDVGRYEQFIFVGNLLGFFWSMGISKAVLSYSSTIKKEEKDQFLPSVLFLLISLGGISALISYFMGDPIQRWLGLEEFEYWNASLLLLFLSTPVALVESRFTIEQAPKKIINYGLVTFIPIILAAVFLLVFKQDLEAFIYAYLFWVTFRFIYTIYINAGRINTKIIKPFFYYSLPLIGHVLLGNGMEFIDGVIVNHYFDTSTFPVFRYGARELPISTIFIVGIVAAMIPVYRSQPESTLASIKEKTRKLITWLFPLSALLMLISPLLFTQVYGKAFLTSALIFNIYLLVLISRILLPQIIIQANHRNQILLVSALLEVGINVGLSLLWVKEFGLYGIAAATFVAYLINKIILIYYVNRHLKISSRSFIHYRTYWTYSLLLLLAFTASWFIYQ